MIEDKQVYNTITYNKGYRHCRLDLIITGKVYLAFLLRYLPSIL